MRVAAWQEKYTDLKVKRTFTEKTIFWEMNFRFIEFNL